MTFDDIDAIAVTNRPGTVRFIEALAACLTTLKFILVVAFRSRSQSGRGHSVRKAFGSYKCQTSDSDTSHGSACVDGTARQ